MSLSLSLSLCNSKYNYSNTTCSNSSSAYSSSSNNSGAPLTDRAIISGGPFCWSPQVKPKGLPVVGAPRGRERCLGVCCFSSLSFSMLFRPPYGRRVPTNSNANQNLLVQKCEFTSSSYLASCFLLLPLTVPNSMRLSYGHS